MNPSENKSFKSRKFISVVLFASLVLLPVTGLMVSISETIENDSLLHLSTILHALSGIAFTIFSILHVVKNWSAMKSYIKQSPKNYISEEAIAALVLVCGMIAISFVLANTLF